MRRVRKIAATILLQESNGTLAGFFGSDSDGVVDGQKKNFSVPDFSGLGGFGNGLHCFLYEIISHHHLKFDFGKKVHSVFTSAVNFCVPFLSSEAFDLGNRHPFDSDFRERFFDILHFEGFDNGFDFLHKTEHVLRATFPFGKWRLTFAAERNRKMKTIHWRRTRLGRYLRHIPRPKHLRGSWLHRKVGDNLLHPDLWKPDRSKVAAGFALGAFFSMIPMPFQMLPTLLLGYLTRVNLPASLVGVWISNPLTTPFLLYAQYVIGTTLLGMGGEKTIEAARNWTALLKEAPLAILLGGSITGLIAAAVGYPVALRVYDWLTKQVEKSRLLKSRKARNKKSAEQKNPQKLFPGGGNATPIPPEK